MLTPSLNAVVTTRLLIVAAVLGTIVFFAPAIFAQDRRHDKLPRERHRPGAHLCI